MMNTETVGSKYRTIAETYSPEASNFAKKLLDIFAQARGRDHVLWAQLRELYHKGDVVLYEEGMDLDAVKDKILLRHAVRGREYDTYDVNAAFGFVDSTGTPVFADLPHNLHDWEGGVTTLTTAILDIGRTYHARLISEPTKLWNASGARRMAEAMLIANRLSGYIRIDKTENPGMGIF